MENSILQHENGNRQTTQKNLPMLKLTALILFLFPAFCFAQDKPVKTTMLDGRVELSVPAGLKKMTDEIWTFKYHSNKKPALAMTDDNAEVNLIGDYTQQPIDTLQIAAFEDTQIGFVKKSRPDMELIEKGVKMSNGKYAVVQIRCCGSPPSQDCSIIFQSQRVDLS